MVSLDQRIQKLCDSARKDRKDLGSLKQLAKLVKNCEQEHLISKSIQIFSHYLKLKPFPSDEVSIWTNLHVYNYATIALDGLSTTAKDLSRWTSVEENLISLWKIVFKWLEFFHQQNVRFPHRLGTSSAALSFELLAKFSGSDRLSHVMKNSPRFMSMLIEMWSSEAIDPEVTTNVANAAYAFYSYTKDMSGPMIHDCVVINHGGGESSVARTALDHFRHQISQPSLDEGHIAVDIMILHVLSTHIPLRNAILQQNSIVYVCDLFRRVSSPENHFRNSNRVSITSNCCFYLHNYLRSNDGVSNIIQALEAGALVSLLRSNWLRSGVSDEHFAAYGSIISRILPKYLIYRSVVVLINKCIRIIDADSALQPIKPLWSGWPALRELALSRQKDLHYHRDLGGNICNYPSCPSLRMALSPYKKCGNCLRTFYCSTSCQRQAWPQHKPMCQATTTLLDRINEPKHRLSKPDYLFIDGVVCHIFGLALDDINNVIQRDALRPAVITLDFDHVPVQVNVRPPDLGIHLDNKNWEEAVARGDQNVRNLVLIRIPAGEGFIGWSFGKDIPFYLDGSAEPVEGAIKSYEMLV